MTSVKRLYTSTARPRWPTVADHLQPQPPRPTTQTDRNNRKAALTETVLVGVNVILAVAEKLLEVFAEIFNCQGAILQPGAAFRVRQRHDHTVWYGHSGNVESPVRVLRMRPLVG